MDTDDTIPTTSSLNFSKEKFEDDVLFYQFLHNNPGAWELYNMVLQRKEADNKIRLRTTKTLLDSNTDTPAPPTPRSSFQTDDLVSSAKKSSSSGGLFKRMSKGDLTQSTTPRRTSGSNRKSWFRSEKVGAESAPADLPAMVMTPSDSWELSANPRFSSVEIGVSEKRKSKRSVEKKKKKGERVEEDIGPPPPNFIPDPPPPETITDIAPRKSHMDSYSLFVSLVNLSTGIDMSTKNWHMKTYRQVFMASKVVDWILENLSVNRPKATQLGYELQTSGFIEGVLRGTIFKDDKFLFQLTEKGRTILREQDFLYFTKAFDPLHGIEIKDRSGHFKKLKECFTGEEFVSWFIDNGLAPSRDRACRLGREFLESHLIEHVLKEQHFKDATLFYHLTKEGLLLLNQNNGSNYNNRNRANSYTQQIRRKQSEVLPKKLEDEIPLSITTPRAHSTSEPPKKHSSQEITEIQISKESHPSKKPKKEKKLSNVGKPEVPESLLLPISKIETRSRSSSTRPKSEPRDYVESPPLEMMNTIYTPCTDQPQSSARPLSQGVTTNDQNQPGNSRRKSLRRESKKSESLISVPTLSKLPEPSQSKLPEPNPSTLLITPLKPRPPSRRLPQRYSAIYSDLTSSTIKETPMSTTPSRVKEKRLTRNRSQDNTLDKENIQNSTEEQSTKNTLPIPEKTSPKKLLTQNNTLSNIPIPQETPKSDPISATCSLYTPFQPPLSESQLSTPPDQSSFSIIIRRFNKRGGVRVLVPSSLDELMNIANTKLKVSGGRLREIDTEAEISDIRLFKADQSVWLTTAEEEKEFI